MFNVGDRILYIGDEPEKYFTVEEVHPRWYILKQGQFISDFGKPWTHNNFILLKHIKKFYIDI